MNLLYLFDQTEKKKTLSSFIITNKIKFIISYTQNTRLYQVDGIPKIIYMNFACLGYISGVTVRVSYCKSIRTKQCTIVGIVKQIIGYVLKNCLVGYYTKS